MTSVVDAYFRAVEPALSVGEERREETTRALRAARIPLFPEYYLALGYLAASLTALVVLLASTWILVGEHAYSRALRAAMVLACTILSFFAVRLLFLVYPRMLATGRGRAIDAEFPSVVTLCYALARGGMGAPEIFRAVAQERSTYGEISREFALVIKNVDELGQDMNSALLLVASTTPSATLKTFLEGLVTILNSGADPRDYFRRQAETQLADADVRMGREVEQAGLLAESYVSGLLVLPLLLVVVLSILSVLGTVQTFFIPVIIFLLVPGGTLAYLILVDIMMPGEPIGADPATVAGPRDAGMHVIADGAPTLPVGEELSRTRLDRELRRLSEGSGAAAQAAERARRHLGLALAQRRTNAALARWREACLEEPWRALTVSAPAALPVALAGAAWIVEKDGHALRIAAIDITLLVALVALVPVSVFHELRMRRAREIEASLPETLSKLSGFNERGVPLLRSFQILAQTTEGPVADEFRALDRDVSWTANLTGALARMRARAPTPRLRKVGILFERGVSATGNLKEVLDIAAAEATTTQAQRAKRRQAMMSYVVVAYVVFAVFLYVLFTITKLFYGANGTSAFAGAGIHGFAGGIPATTAQEMYFSAVLIQGACCGLVAGKLGEGQVLSGLKHAAILCTLGWLVFALGVLA